MKVSSLLAILSLLNNGNVNAQIEIDKLIKDTFEILMGLKNKDIKK
jgi:hypothetical protein